MFIKTLKNMFSPIKIKQTDITTESRCYEYKGNKFKCIQINDDCYIFNCPLEYDSNYSTIFKAVRLKDRKKVILKQYFRNCQRYYDLERDALRNLKHDNIVSLYDFSDKYSTLIMENGERGDLFEIIEKYTGFGKVNPELIFIDEKIIRTIIKQLINAIDYAYTKHEKSFCHRDLKLENIVLDYYGKLILIDWGFSEPYTDYLKFNNKPGSPVNMSPEIINEENKSYCGHKSDIWSIGIIILQLSFGTSPFYSNGNSSNAIIDSQKKCPLYQMLHNFKWKEYISSFVSKIGRKNKMSSQLNDLLDKIFKPEEKRITSAEFKDDEWLKGETVTNSELLKYLNC